MTNNTRNAIYACLLLLAITVGACVKDSTVPESIHKQPQDFQLADARKHYEENIENLCFPEIYLKPIIQTKGSNYFHNLKQTPLWDRFNFTENGWSYIYEIPIIYNITLKASMGHLTQDGHLKKEDKEVKFQSNLIIQKYKKSGNVHIFLSTVIGYISEPDNEIEGESPWLWTGDRRNFTGYQFFTNPDGSFRSAFQYKDSHRTSIILSLYDKNEEYVFPQSFFSISLGSLGTKGEGIQEYKKYCWDCQREFDWTESYCPQCGTMLEMLDEITIIPQPDHICDKCNFLIENCVCEDHDYGDEDQCPYCLGHDCSGECRNTGGDGTGSGGGTTPGGNQGEGGENNDEQTSLIDKFKEKADEKSKNEIIPLLIEMERKNDCMTNQLLSSLQDVEIQYDANLATAICSTYVNYTTQVEKRIIRWGMNIAGAEETASLILLEELIHAMQFQMQWINDSNKINAEVEAKVAVYKYAVHHNILNKLTGYGYWQDAIEPYLANPTQETYSDVVDFVRWLEPNVYGDEVEFKYDSRIVDLQVIGTFFCY